MKKHPQFQRLMFLFAIAGLVAATANYACLPDVCADLKTAEFRTMDEVNSYRIRTLNEALSQDGLSLNENQRLTLKTQGKLLGVAKLGQPVKHPDGTIEMPANWLQPLPEGHPWASKLTPADDAFYSFFEERVLRPRLYDPENPQHVEWANAYLAKSKSNDPDFIGWTYANRTECSKIRYDAKGTMAVTDTRF
ncbi:MAG: hypothetical protein SF187_16500 [Deltaproteobacteria bacterium]|nr:hypothetical protein [Deltaproteobacteria bacterium]